MAVEVQPNLRDYDSTRAGFSWDAAREALAGLPGGGLNMAHEAVDRHVAGGRGEHIALRWLGKAGEQRDFSYADLARRTNQFANALTDLGIQTGERVYALCGRVPELYVTALGTLKRQAVFCPLFSAFGPEPIRARLEIGDGRVLVTTESLYRRKVSALRQALPKLEYVILVDAEEAPEGTLAWGSLVDRQSDRFEIPVTDPESMALLHFTSGTTGAPKGVVHVHQAVVMHHLTGKLALDLHPEDVFWCTADPGWVTGTSYGIIAPLTSGATLIVDEAEFDAERWYRILEEQRVSVWYSAPTAIRMLMKVGAEVAHEYDLSQVRFMASVGEPLNPEAVVWSHQTFGQPFHDNWWQTETGGIMIANYRSMDVRPGSMGKPMPGIEAAIVRVEGEGAERAVRVIEEPGVEGELALRPGWPSMFRGYLHNPERYAKAFVDGWYLSGDLAKRDPDGYFWFVGRADDLIKTAGHLIGPFEVESVLMEHPAVAEVGVIGKPDPVAMQIVKAFVTLKQGHEPSEALMRELVGHARKRLGPAVAPREIEFTTGLPKTRSGKIMRRLLKARELGLPEGDTSTLEGSHD